MKEIEKFERDMDEIRALVIGLIYVEQKNSDTNNNDIINKLAKIEKDIRFLKETVHGAEDAEELIPELKMIGTYTLSEINENSNKK